MLDSLVRAAMRLPALRRLLLLLRVRELASFALRRRPLVRTVAGSGLSYRVTSLDNVLVAREVLQQGEYAALRILPDVRSFADLGCNAGYFTLFAAALGDPRTIRGLAIDAHPQMVKDTAWHIERNGLANVHAVWGLVGAEAQSGTARFFVNVDAAGSSQYGRAPEGNVTKDPWTAIEAPVLSLAREWEARFGTAPCDVLKIDIEGSEADFLRAEPAFLGRVSAIAVEIHRWLVDADQFLAHLDALGFTRQATLRSDASIEVALLLNRTGRYAHLLRSAATP